MGPKNSPANVPVAEPRSDPKVPGADVAAVVPVKFPPEMAPSRDTEFHGPCPCVQPDPFVMFVRLPVMLPLPKFACSEALPKT